MQPVPPNGVSVARDSLVAMTPLKNSKNHGAKRGPGKVAAVVVQSHTGRLAFFREVTPKLFAMSCGWATGERGGMCDGVCSDA